MARPARRLVGLGALAAAAATACGAIVGLDATYAPESADASATVDGATRDAAAGADATPADAADAADVSAPDASPGEAGAFDASAPLPYVVFITSNSYAAIDLVAADQICDAAGKTGSKTSDKSRKLHAWISDSAGSPDLKLNDHAWYGTDGKLRFSSLADITSGQGPKLPLDHDENGNGQALGPWTGTDNDGKPLNAYNCLNWTTDVGNAVIGSAATTVVWSNAGQTSCMGSDKFPIYCFEE